MKIILGHKFDIGDKVIHNNNIGIITEIVAYISATNIFYKYKTSIYENIYLFEEDLKLYK